MRLRDLLPNIPMDDSAGALDIRALASDSRKVAPGTLFFAIAGAAGDGLAFANDAVARGAAAIISDRMPAHSPAIPFVQTDDVRLALAMAAARITPGQPAIIAAITGTSGKTSVAAFLRQIWARLGHRAASLGTIGLVGPNGDVSGSLTTPDPITLHQTLDKLAADGVTHLAMEASSHGLDQRRLDGVHLSAGAFTNLSRDHLDYHASVEDYLGAKLRLFDALLHPGQSAIFDADAEIAPRVVAAANARGLRVLSVGRHADGICLLNVRAHELAADLQLEYADELYEITLPLAGEFQISNALVAAGLAIACGDAPAKVFAALEHLDGAPGRLELVGQHNNAAVFVDYAHKPDALEKVLAALRPLTRGRLILVLGCGGDRDRGKRAIMGEIAGREADIAIVTDDNPRSEDASTIRTAILDGARGGRAQIFETGDRAAAIGQGVAMLKTGDVLLVAGKGHEAGQIIGSKVLPFSDRDAVLDAIHSASEKINAGKV